MSLLSLPRDVRILLPDFLHNIEDYINLTSTCRSLHSCLLSSTSASTILRPAAAQTKIFFRPSPHFLVAATARELGHWARKSDTNEAELASRMSEGIEALLELALEKGCGLTLSRIRELHQLRFDIVNPVTDIIDQCVAQQWYDVDDFWGGGRSDACTISSEPGETFFHLAIYDELFGPDFGPFLLHGSQVKRLKVETRLEFIKYIIPDFATECLGSRSETVDPRRAVKPTGPYKRKDPGDSSSFYADLEFNHNIALTWVLKSSRWQPHWHRFRQAAGCTDFCELQDGWWWDEETQHPHAWKQRLWEGVMMGQGLEGLGMMSPALSEEVRVERWGGKVREWKEKIERLGVEREPGAVVVGKQATVEWPYLLGDLRICAGGYVAGT